MTKIILAVTLVLFTAQGCMIAIGNNMELFPKAKTKEKFIAGEENAPDKIVVLPLSGPIMDEKKSGGFSSSVSITPDQVYDALVDITKDKSVKGVILEINSPGGSASASETIYKTVDEFKKQTKIPVVAFFDGLATSGAYYISQASDHIVANPQCITGSIGVITVHIYLEALLKNKLDIEVTTLKSGAYKDIGSPFRKMTDSDKQYIQKLIDQVYERFLSVVSEGRKIDKESLKKIADGSIFLAPQAKDKKLIDQVGYLTDAITKTKDLAGLKTAKVVKVDRGSASFSFMTSKDPLMAAAERMMDFGNQILLMPPEHLLIK